jgi:hypothetical protein
LFHNISHTTCDINLPGAKKSLSSFDEEVDVKLQLTSVTLLALALWVAPRPVAAQQPAADDSKLIQSPRAISITNASTPEDHLRLAEYFRDLATQEQALAESYDEIAAIYKKKTAPPGLDPASARKLRNQYQRLAETEKKAASTAENVSAYHSRLALELTAHTALAVKHANPGDQAYRR